jgi:hypothetical protein
MTVITRGFPQTEQWRSFSPGTARLIVIAISCQKRRRSTPFVFCPGIIR